MLRKFASLKFFDQALFRNNGIARRIMVALVGRDLEHISHYLRRVGRNVQGADDLRLSRPASGRWRPDALDDVTSAINEMRAEISRRHAELVDINHRLETTIQSTPLAIYTRDLQGLVTSWNPAAERMFGWSAAEIIGQPLLSVPANKTNETENLRARVLGGESIVQQEVRRQRRDGALIDISTTLSPLRDSSGKIYAYVAIAADISERRKADESLRLAASVYQVSSEAMMVTGADNRIIAINPAFSRMTGYSLEEVAGRYSDFLRAHPEDQTFFNTMWQELKAAGTWQGEVWGRRKNGEIYPTWITINSILNDDGSVFRWVAMFSDITKKKESEELIWSQANFDTLTGLPNRRMLHDRLEQELKKAHRSGLPIALLFLDLDRFKEINDTLGHDIGDLLLKDAALRIASCVRETDTVARLGGDEFTVILGELEDPSSVERVAQSILRKLSEPFLLGDEKAYVSVSIGITLYPEDASAVDTLLKNADQAMYAAKSQGRNRCSYFTPAMQEAAQTRMRLAVDLRTALANGQFMVYYQPIVELATGSIYKAEALIRWQHPQRGLVSPAEFIPIAEDTGLIVDIGEWVFRQAAQQAGQWRTAHHPEFQISVNKSPVQFHSASSGHALWSDHLQTLGLPGQSIVVEITEGLLLDASSTIFDQLLAYRDVGIQVSLDDFGTGYSSLSYLKKFDIDYLKIDQSFVRNLAPNSDDMALCEAIIVMAHKLSIKVIAEGVETDQQRDLLAAAGCDYGQGYLFSRPLPPAQIEPLLRSWAGP
ncbi:MAG: EAL domain-containing protein [Rhodocyclaceae bacterium]|nr:MAG: EAL domain-containing protein [Rhodocyclaceae bacterium]